MLASADLNLSILVLTNRIAEMSKPKISRRKLKRLKRQGRFRDEFEIWVDRHNHKMELVRTVTSILGLVVSSVVLLRVFGAL